MRAGAVTSPDPSAGPLAAKIYRLIEARWPVPARRPGLGKIAQEIRAATGGSVSATYLHELLKGRKRNLSMEQINVLVKFFDVQPQYFFNDEYAARLDAQLEMAMQLRDSRVRAVLARAEGLSPEGLESVIAVMNQVRKIENLPAPSEPPERASEADE